MLFGVIRSLTEAIDAKDPYTKGHSQRVARIAVKLAETLGLDAHLRGDIYLMGLLHDVGKIGIKDDVLKKTGQLEEHEYVEIKKHVIIGVEILKGLTKLQHVLPAVRHHHENYDGSGYPDALIGEAIPFEARLLAVADAFDAMASDRPYRKGLTDHRMQKIFRDGSGGQWDPEVVDALFDCWNDVAQITGLPSNGSLEAAVGQVMSGPASGRRR
jgi:putative nucleotidyltransferase with HDIG domain